MEDDKKKIEKPVKKGKKIERHHVKSILKTSPSFDRSKAASHSDIKWDEANIAETLNPVNKDYGLMKVSEPETPFHWLSDDDDISEDDEDSTSLDPNLLALKLDLSQDTPPKIKQFDIMDDDSSKDNVSSQFKQKRKLHYNEFYAVKLARKLLSKEEDDDDDDDDDNNSDKDSSKKENGILKEKDKLETEKGSNDKDSNLKESSSLKGKGKSQLGKGSTDKDSCQKTNGTSKEKDKSQSNVTKKFR